MRIFKALALSIALVSATTQAANVTLLGDSLLAWNKNQLGKILQSYGHDVHDMTQGGILAREVDTTDAAQATQFYGEFRKDNVVVVMLGTNDWIRGRSWADTATNLIGILQDVHESHQIVCLAHAPIGALWTESEAHRDRWDYMTLNAGMHYFQFAGLCTEVLDLAVMFPDPYDTRYFEVDELHLSSGATKAIAYELDGIIEELVQ